MIRLKIRQLKNWCSREIVFIICKVAVRLGLKLVPLSNPTRFSDLLKVIHRQQKLNIIYDVGSNRGVWSQVLKDIIPNAQIYAFEANEIHFPYPLNLFRKSFCVALLDEETVRDFWAIGGTGDSLFKEISSHYDGVVPVKIPTKRLDELINTHNLPLPDLIKIDTQGSELAILRGIGSYLDYVKYILIEVSLRPYNVEGCLISEVLEFLRRKKFEPVAIVEIHTDEQGFIFQLDLLFQNLYLTR